MHPWALLVFWGASSILSACNRVESVSGDKITLLTSSGELVEVDKAQLKPVDMPSLTENQLRGRKGLPGKSWVMVIDLSKCRNARECMKACQRHHQLRPEQHHINVLQMQDSPKTPLRITCLNPASIATIRPVQKFAR